jgi:hypothetical protein
LPQTGWSIQVCSETVTAAATGSVSLTWTTDDFAWVARPARRAPKTRW